MAVASSTVGAPAASSTGGAPASAGGQTSTTPVASVKPNVLLVVDSSLSMQQVFGGETRWAALRAALFDPALGLVPRFESKVYFGLALFTGPQLVAMQAPPSECPIWSRCRSGQATDETAFPGPNVIVLATDGEPNTCENNQDMATGRAGSEGAITKAHAAGIRTYVLSVGDDVAAEHLRRIANLGQGLPAEDPTERYLRADEPAELRAALDRLFSELTTP